MHRSRRSLVAVVSLAVALAPMGPATPARAARSPRGDERLVQVQRTLDPITQRKRATYARAVMVERQLVRARRHLADADARLAQIAELEGRPGWTEALRWGLLEVVYSARWVSLIRQRLDGLEAQGNAFREQIKHYFGPTHLLIHRLLEQHGRSRSDWSRFWPIPVRTEGPLRACPVAGPWSLTNTFGAPRPGGRTHAGNDILAAWETPVVAAHDGFAFAVQNSLGGRAVLVRGAAGDTYYAHLSSYAPLGAVRAGDVIGFVGNSGNARGRIHHVHFEWRPGGGAGVDPYRMLLEVCGG